VFSSISCRSEPVHILIARFHYDVTEDEIRGTADELAPHFASIPGCIEKTWLIDPAAQLAGGVYKFRDRGSLETYLASDLWAAVKSNPHFSELSTLVFGVMEGPSQVTHAIPQSVLAH
jgi:hypothetical protein